VSSRTLLPAFALLLAPATAQAEWKPVEEIKTYSISGKTGLELYESIGEHGPAIGKGKIRTVAHTSFSLKWSRDYQPEGTSCRLVSAKPFLTITYTLPKPKGKLPPETREVWDHFITGITAHEKVHGQQIMEMVERIIATTVGATVETIPAVR